MTRDERLDRGDTFPDQKSPGRVTIRPGTNTFGAVALLTETWKDDVPPGNSDQQFGTLAETSASLGRFFSGRRCCSALAPAASSVLD